MKRICLTILFVLLASINISLSSKVPVSPAAIFIPGGKSDPDPGVGTYSRKTNVLSYTWRHKAPNGLERTFSFSLNLGTDWDEMQKVYAGSNQDQARYNRFVVEDPYRDVLKVVAQELCRLAKSNDLLFAEVILSFVQALPYDDDNHHIQRYAVETLIDCRGDCSDTAVLFTGLMWALNYDCIFLHYPGHLAVGVWITNFSQGTYYLYNERKYYLCETTGTGNPIGFGLNEHQHGSGTAEIEGVYY